MKNMLKSGLLGLLLIAGLCGVSCTDGTFEGVGGGGNFIITGLADYTGHYIEAAGTSAAGPALTFKEAARVRIGGGKVSAPLYNSATGEKYAGTSAQPYEFTIQIFADELVGVAEVELKCPGVTVYPDGSALVDWK